MAWKAFRDANNPQDWRAQSADFQHELGGDVFYSLGLMHSCFANEYAEWKNSGLERAKRFAIWQERKSSKGIYDVFILPDADV